MSGLHYLPLTPGERREMLATMGLSAMDELFADIPGEMRLSRALEMPEPLSEREAWQHLRGLAGKNRNLQECVSFLGGGVYDHFLPAVVHHVTGRSEFYTSYTPYQAEISQGMLQAIFEYQTYITQLTGMEVSNASLYDGASALAEAALMAARITGRNRLLVPRAVNPFFRRVLATYSRTRGLSLEEVPLADGATDWNRVEQMVGADAAALVLQSPNFFGVMEETDRVREILEPRGALLIAVTDPISLGLLPAPAEYGADIVVGEGQALGNPPSFGGPLLGFLAARERYVRSMPGRLVGQTEDREGRRGFVLTFQTREQHVRRERATSNICTNQALNALAAAVYLAALGPEGLREVAESCLRKSAYARQRLEAVPGCSIPFSGPFFKEFPVCLPSGVRQVNRHLLARNILGGLDLSGCYPELENTALISVTENRTRHEIDTLVEELGGFR